MAKNDMLATMILSTFNRRLKDKRSSPGLVFISDLFIIIIKMGLLDYFRSSDEAAPTPPVKVGKSGKKICCSVSRTSSLIYKIREDKETRKGFSWLTSF